jgi:mevalonate kinase
VEAVTRCVSERAGGLPGGRVRVDSSAFYHEDRKRGYGSSAAVAVALSRALLTLAGVEDPLAALEVALQAHRQSQGGQGSGYDVLASFHGGLGQFTGGRRPDWKPLSLPWLGPLILVPGARAVSTPQAIDAWRAWRARQPQEALRFVQASNRAVELFARAASRREARMPFAQAREMGLRLGAAVGAEAAFDSRLLPPGCSPQDCKSLGAGNELGWFFPETPWVPPGLPVLEIEARGLLCEP